METTARARSFALLLCLASCLCLALLLGCKAKPAGPAESTVTGQAASVPPEEMAITSVTVAPFTQVFSDSELLFGETPPGSETAPTNTLRMLDATLQGALKTAIPNANVESCMASAPTAAGDRRALDRWVTVGKCAGASYLLVPQVAYWVERKGGPMGSDRPAGVVLDFSVVDVASYSIVGHYRYSETQVPLSANLLTVDKFLARGAQFVLAADLAREGVHQAVKRMGL